MNGTTIPTGRDNTYTPAETVPAVKTGRAVFVDSEKYESDTAYKARVDKYVAEGFHIVTEGSVPEGSDEEGSSTKPLIVNAIFDDDAEEDVYTLDKTWQEIKDAFPNAYIAITGDDNLVFLISAVNVYNIDTPLVTYEGRTADSDYHLIFSAADAEDYPTTADLNME